jgi:predicted transposase/invertase (TIGR01784 family)
LDLTWIDREENGLLSDWLRFINGEKKEDFTLVTERNEVIGAAFEELKVISSDENNWRLYEGRLKQQRYMWAIKDDARREGMREGEYKKAVELAKKALYKGLGVDVAAELTGLTVDEVLRLQQ